MIRTMINRSDVIKKAIHYIARVGVHRWQQVVVFDTSKDDDITAYRRRCISYQLWLRD